MQPRSPEFKAERLDIQAFAKAGATLEGRTPIASMERLSASAHGAPEGGDPTPEGEVRWTAHGEVRERLGAAPQVWLHLSAETALPMTCQRCLQPVVEPLEVDRWFRFVASEEEAAEEDTDAEEDLLVLQRQLKLLELIEDELLLALPVIARHDACPDPLPQPEDLADDAEEETKAPNPFAVLEALKKGPPRRRH
jgi:uncharacterized protein